MTKENKEKEFMSYLLGKCSELGVTTSGTEDEATLLSRLATKYSKKELTTMFNKSIQETKASIKAYEDQIEKDKIMKEELLAKEAPIQALLQEMKKDK